MKKTVKHDTHTKSHHSIFPPSISKGDTIGLVAPAGPIINTNNFIAGIGILEKNGFRVKYNRQLLNVKGYLAGSDQERADEFNRLWSDPGIKALIAVRGGYGCMRMLDLIDMKQIQSNPKILIGFSDLTVLLTVIHKRTGLVTYHGPVVTTLAGIDKQSQASFFNVLNGKIPDMINHPKVTILKEGNAEGLLLGGNLTTLVHMIDTPYELSWDNKILFIEDTGESPYRLDRLLTHLSLSGRLQKIKGLILGTFSDDARKENGAMQRAVHKRILELFEGCDVPVWANFPVGHSRRNLTLPIGIDVEINSPKKTLKVFQKNRFLKH
jgi:muramoyltetrapeptide carboxypeptidase